MYLSKEKEWVYSPKKKKEWVWCQNKSWVSGGPIAREAHLKQKTGVSCSQRRKWRWKQNTGTVRRSKGETERTERLRMNQVEVGEVADEKEGASGKFGSHWWWAMASATQLGWGIVSFRKGYAGHSNLMPFKAFAVASLFVGAAASAAVASLHASGIHKVSSPLSLASRSLALSQHRWEIWVIWEKCWDFWIACILKTAAWLALFYFSVIGSLVVSFAH